MPNPLPMLNLNGFGTQRGVTIALPTDRVRGLLPPGLELGSQDVSAPGTHPVIVFFHDIFRARMSFPTLIPSLTYREHSVGIPFAYLKSGARGAPAGGPYYFMPTLYLDSILATLGGVAYWGFAKRPARVTVTGDRYTVYPAGRRNAITSMTWEASGPRRPLHECEAFEPIRRILDQPVISVMPMALGPFYVLSDFEKRWDVATIRPLRTAVEVYEPYVPGYGVGRYPSEGRSPGIDESVLGSYEVYSPMRLTLPYPPFLFGS